MSYEKGVSFIGGGNMASAIIDAILNAKILPANEISVFDPSPERKEFFLKKGINLAESGEELAKKEDVLFIAVKPQIIDTVLESIKGKINSKCVVSIAAGISVSHIKNIIGNTATVVRALPNTPMLTLNGMTVVAQPDNVSDELFEFVLSIFRAAGEVSVLPEEKINEAIPLSSSSPAFFFRMIKAMAEMGVAYGIPFDEAFKLSAVAMRGSAQYAIDSRKSMDELIAQVSSPGGTTVAALSAFDDFGFEAFVKEATKRCIDRAYELGKGSK